MELFISEAMTGKMEGIASINTHPALNPYCIAMRSVTGSICSKCYCRHSENYQNVKQRYTENYNLLTKTELQDIPFINHRLVRIHSFGEIANALHFQNIDAIIKTNKAVTFALWTKRPELVTRFRKNCVYIYSSPRINEQAKRSAKFNKVFTVYTKEYVLKNGIEINCHGKSCLDCRKCYTIGNRDVYINEIVK